MHTTTPSPSSGVPRGSRRLLILAGLCGLAAVVGLAIGTQAGGLGPALRWLGALGTLALSLLAALVHAVARRRPGIDRIVVAGLGSLGAFLAGVVALEVAWRTYKPLPPHPLAGDGSLGGLHRFDPMLGWSGRPGARAEYRIAEGGFVYQNNARGYRDVEQDPDLRRGRRVVVLGDSLAEGYGVDLEQGACHVLRTQMPDHQVFQQGCQSYSLDQMLLAWRRDVRPLRPDVVVCLVLLRLGFDQSHPVTYGLPKPWMQSIGGRLVVHGVPVPSVEAPGERLRVAREALAAQVVGPRSALHSLFFDHLGRATIVGERFTEAWVAWRQRRTGAAVSDLSVTILGTLQAEVEREGARFVFAAAPERRTYQQPEALVRFQAALAALQAKGVPVLDLSVVLAERGFAGYARDHHPDPEGHRRIAGALAGWLQRNR